MKMSAAAAGLLLVCAGAVLIPAQAQAQDPVLELPGLYSKGVDLVSEQLASHTGLQNHYGFLRSLARSEIESGFGVRYLFHHLYLKPTTCPRGTSDPDPLSCPFVNNRPLMDCAVCYKTAGEQIESEPKPYVHCIQKPRLTEAMKATRLEHCRKMSYNSGAMTLLAVVQGQKK